jgi:succinate dehydrogenase / fumarate reductase cytochrome b subunit
MPNNPYINLPLPKGLPKAFLFRRLHSIAGLFFILFLCEHMLTNSTSALLIGERGSGFVRAVNFLQSLPYLPLVELFLLAVPIAIHALLGILYCFEARFNSFSSDGSTPHLTRYLRNQAFTWQRITAAIVVIGAIAHVTSMRFLQRPQEIDSTPQTKFAIPVVADPGLITLAPRLKTTLITPDSQAPLLTFLQRRTRAVERQIQRGITPSQIEAETLQKERLMATHTFIADLHPTDVSWTAICEDFGTACLLVVRENFRTPWICVLYTIFVLAASFHAANGLWTFFISWGVTLNEGGRRVVRGVGTALGLALLAGGLASIWLTYWVTLNT